MKNVIWFKNINSIGGVETYEWELVKKYSKTKDITIYYETGDQKQISRLSKYVRVKKWRGETVECERLFTNYGFFDFINKCNAKDYYQVIHADFKAQKIKPLIDERFKKYICVSEVVKKSYQELTGFPDDKFIVCHNPLTIDEEDRKPCLLLGSFTRLTSEKGKNRMQELIKRLDALDDFHYIWFIYTNDTNAIKSDNVCYMAPVINGVRNIISTCDLIVQLSDCEGWSYTINEAKCLSRVLRTPLPSAVEMGETNDIVLEFNLSNINEVIDKLKQMYREKKIKTNNYVPVEDKYGELLLDGISNYKGEEKMKVKALKAFENVNDTTVGRCRQENEVFEVTEERLILLENFTINGHSIKLVEVINEPTAIIKDYPVEDNKEIKTEKVKKAKKKKDVENGKTRES